MPLLTPVVADNVGDNVGDIAGMGADLFGSFAESTCAALVISSVSSLGASHIYQVRPLLLHPFSSLTCHACLEACSVAWPPEAHACMWSSLRRMRTAAASCMRQAASTRHACS